MFLVACFFIVHEHYVRVVMNDHTYINLEMQVVNEYNWVERSLCYFCRSFDHLGHGQDYREVKPSIQIGLLNFTLFPENPEFYATHQYFAENTS